MTARYVWTCVECGSTGEPADLMESYAEYDRHWQREHAERDQPAMEAQVTS